MQDPAPTYCPNGHPQADAAARYCLQCGAHVGIAIGACSRHPERSALIACPRCGTFACGECVQVQPDGSQLCLACAQRPRLELPWDRREEVGTIRAFWQTSWSMLTRPNVTLAMTPPEGSVGSSLWFAIIAQFTAALTTLGMYALMGLTVGAIAATQGEAGFSWETAGIIALVVVGVAVLIVGMGAGGTLVLAALDHLVLKLIGANPKPFPVTLRAMSLSSSASLVALIPICGAYAYVVWVVILRVFAYRQLHGLSTGKATLGALLVPGLLLGAVMAFYVAMIGLAAMAPPTPD